jgi:hypothetical protein
MVLMVVSVGTVMAKLFHEPKSERKKSRMSHSECFASKIITSYKHQLWQKWRRKLHMNLKLKSTLLLGKQNSYGN